MADFVNQKIQWDKPVSFGSRKYRCAYCGADIASEKGYPSQQTSWGYAYICICHHCTRPTFIDFNLAQYPGASFGNTVADITDIKIETLYREARASISANAFTASVLCCRKILMHIAVSKGAEAGKSFVSYVEFLADNNYIPPDARGWVDHIRQKGNEANHEIHLSTPEDAKDLVSFVEMLLKVIFEFPATVARRIKKA